MISEPFAPSITRVSLHGRRLQLHGLLRATVARAVDDIGPLHQLRQIRRIVSKALARDIGDEHGAGAVGGIVKLVAAVVVAEVLGVFRAQERALVMVEPPGQPRIGRILEIDDRIHIAIEKPVFKKLGSFVSQAGEFKVGARSVLSLVKAAKISRRGRTVETVIVIENSHPHEFMSAKRGKLSSLTHLGSKSK